MLDLDEFNEINDTLGHSAGDQLLRDVSRRLGRVAAGDTVARLGGDEFAILSHGVGGESEAIRLAEKVAAQIRQPYVLDGLTIEVMPSIGIALFPRHARDFESLLRFADSAMYEAKRRRTGIEVYEPGRGIDRRLVGMGGELRRAIEDGQLTLHYQPKASLVDGRIIGAEGLVRWLHPERGLVPPDHFIPLAERSGLIRELTQVVLEQASAQARDWRDGGLSVPIAINLSTRDLIDVALVDQVDQLLTRNRIPPSALELEITESVLMADPMRAEAIVARLKELGIRISIDDFGTGYSSLAYLRRLPVDSLKIDRTFVETLGDDSPDEVIVRSTIDLAHNLGLTVVAEGIETAAMWSRLRALGCDEGQGYHISRPLDAPAASAFLRRQGGALGSPFGLADVA
jgi:diguanylate cyclase (GGDEF)-like protein